MLDCRYNFSHSLLIISSNFSYKLIRMVRGAEECKDNLGELLPAVLLFDILSRLSVKTLSKFKCVSKSWNHLISHDISFHILHREKSITKEPYVLFLDSDGTLRFTSSDMDGNDSINYTYPLPVCNMFCISPICCDLFCFATGWDIYLCNPSMRRVHTLPKSNSTSNPNPLIYLEEHTVGFGYITSKREYIVVNMLRVLRSVVTEDEDGEVFSEINPFNPYNNNGYNSDGKVICEMYTFCPDSSVAPCSINHRFSPYYPYGSSWRAISDVCPRWVDRHLNGLVVNTSMYWLIERDCLCYDEFSSLFSAYERKSNELILSLDIEKEKFEIICCPPGWESPDSETSDDFSISLVDLKGTLCVANASLVRTSVLELWALTAANNDDSNGGSGRRSRQARFWVKEYSIKMDIPLPTLEVLRPLICPTSSRNGEILLASPVLNKFYIYNVDKEYVVREVSGPFEGKVPTAGFSWESFLTL